MRRVDTCLIVLGVIAIVDFAAAFASGVVDRRIAVALFLLALAALAAAGLVARMAIALPSDRRTRRIPPRRPEERVVQLESLARTLELAGASSFDLHHRLRPIAREIAAARLARRGIALDRQPERARAMLGERTWELVRPDREEPVTGRLGRGWSASELRHVVESLEAV